MLTVVGLLCTVFGAQSAQARRLKQQVVVSRSLGLTFSGRLQNGVALPLRGKQLGVLSVFHTHGTNYGTAELIGLLRHTATQVAVKHRGARVMVGNIANRYGGRLVPSVTHQSGRDVDIAFFLLAGKRRLNASVYFTKFDKRLTDVSGTGVRFDVARNWALVRALLSHATVDVQRIFVAKHLKRALLRYARVAGASRILVRRAARVLLQPGTAVPHDDHFHVRIYCSAADRSAGCIDRKPLWPWVAKRRKARRWTRRARRLRIASHKTWWRKHCARRQQTSARPGFCRAFPKLCTRRRAVKRLVRLTARTDYLGRCAERLLARRVHYWSSGTWPSATARYAHWTHWCQRTPRRCR